ncbi:MAG: nucleoside monophosphate kinase [Anaerolineae bacterium]|nr:nucleoside monophosphate kinase [Anaerolineae bacterium]
MGLYIILMGVQGAGKGVQAGFISETYTIPHVSTGDLFRAMKTREDDLAQRVQAIMAAGKLVDDDTTNEVVADRLAQEDAQNGVILDGYPRNQQQAAFLEKYLAEKGEQVNAVLLLNLDLYTAFKRAFGRVTAPNGDSYNYYYKRDNVDFSVEKDPSGDYPPRMIAKLNGETLKRRGDDADAMAVVKRIDTYLELTQPLLEYYGEKGIVHEVDAAQDIAVVSEAIQQVIDGVR